MDRNRIVVNFHPFMVSQEVICYVNGGQNKKISWVPLDEVINQINYYCNEYNTIDKIYLCGNTNFVKKFQKDFMTKYANNRIEIAIVEK